MNNRSFEEVYMDNYKPLYNYIYMQLLHRQDAEDIFSEVFIKAMDAYESYNPFAASEKTWLFRIAKNSLIDYYRHNAANPVNMAEDEELATVPYDDPELEAIEDDTNRIVYLVLKQLRAEEREILLMRHIRLMKNPEIAQELGITEKAVSECIRRVLIKCHKIMEQMQL